MKNGIFLLLLSLAALTLAACSDDETCGCDTRAPDVAITFPADGDTVARGEVLAVTVAADDASGVASVQVLLDDQPLGAPLLTPPWAAVWNTADSPHGVHALTARAVDASGVSGLAEPVAVQVGYCDEYELWGILRTDETGAVLGGDTADWNFDVSDPGWPLIAHPAYPNPFGPTTTLRFELAAAGAVTVTIVDDHCRTVRILVDGVLAAGVHAVAWDGTDTHGALLPNGIYGCVIDAGVGSAYGDLELFFIRDAGTTP
jgi:hypothetical protein